MLKKLTLVFRAFWRIPYISARIICVGLLNGKASQYVSAVCRALLDGPRLTLVLLERLLEAQNKTDGVPISCSGIEQRLTQLHENIRGLHSLLPYNPLYSYSCLLTINNPLPSHLKRALESLFSQSASSIQVVIGVNGSPNHDIREILTKVETQQAGKVRIIEAPMESVSRLLNRMAEAASGNILLFCEAHEVLRGDLLFRFEQAFRLFPDPEKTVVCSKEAGTIFPERRLCFPYLFDTRLPSCIAIPRTLWNKVGRFHEIHEGAHFYDLFLRLNLAGARIHQTPSCLYEGTCAKLADTQASVKALTHYTHQKGLNWKIEAGDLPGTLRALPEIKTRPSIHAIIPYKNQKSLTLAAAKSLLEQTDVDLKITAVDNRSDDLSVGRELQKMGVEVLRIDEPFNFSRLNNLAVQRTTIGMHCESVFFMNNDVELSDKGALLEMSRWVEQPDIGMVGCRLHYPNGLLQHGGMDIDPSKSTNRIVCGLSESLLPFESLRAGRTLRVTDSVSGAAILMKRKLFIALGGFDEIWFPNGHSDINLAMKLKSLKLHSFYTPYASGIHHESMSRTIVESFEEYETMTALNNDYFTNVPLKPLS